MAKFLAKGSTITFNSIAIGKVRNFGRPDAQKEEIDVTDHDSTGVYREFVAGLADPGTVTVECNYDPDDAGQQALVANFALVGNNVQEVVITLPAAATASGVATITFDAYVASIVAQLPGTDAAPATRTFTLRVSGNTVEAIA